LVSVAVTALLASGCATNPRSILKQSYQAMSELKGIEWQVDTSTTIQNKSLKGSIRFIQMSGGQGATARWKIRLGALIPRRLLVARATTLTHTW